MIVSYSYTFFGLLSSRTESTSIKYLCVCVCENYGEIWTAHFMFYDRNISKKTKTAPTYCFLRLFYYDAVNMLTKHSKHSITWQDF